MSVSRDGLDRVRMKKTRWNYVKTGFFILAASIMIGHGFRMLYQGLFQPTSYYPAPLPSSVDFWFDWFFLAVLGLLLLGYSLKMFYDWYSQEYYTSSSDENTFHSPT